MKIAICGFSGSGKSTLAGKLGDMYDVPVVHLDSVHFLPNWVERKKEEEIEYLTNFLDNNDSWVIDGNYTNTQYERRLAEADLIIFMLFNRFSSLHRVTKRYRTYKGKSRPDIGAGCEEKLDWEFIRWVLHDGRTHRKKQIFRESARKYKDKVRILKNQRQLDALTKELMEGKIETAL